MIYFSDLFDGILDRERGVAFFAVFLFASVLE